jgi:anti-sigma regulatory factor (Ser/Thr protein kinase)
MSWDVEAGFSPEIRILALTPELAQAALGREFVAVAARDAGFADERVFDIMVACSEAIANAIEHAAVKGEVEVRARVRPDGLEIHIEGPGSFKMPRRSEDSRHRGLGIPLMAQLADHLALCSGPRGGTLVSLTFYLLGAKRAEEPLPPSSLSP